MIARETDRSRRTGVLADAAKEARAEIESQRMKLDRFGWTDVDARSASLLAERGHDIGSTTETFGELQSVHGTTRCLVALMEAGSKHANHRSCPAYERLKLLLQRGKSEIWFPRSAMLRPNQL